MKRISAVVLLVAGMAAFAAGCGGSSSAHDAAKTAAEKSGEAFVPYVPSPGNTEQRNYNDAQKLYNDPATIIWCSAFPTSSTAPIITVPISGKLTSSTTTAFQPERVDEHEGDDNEDEVVTARSVDGLYHPNPPAYRYGFTPGGQLVDFFNMPTICTTQPLEFQRQSVTVKVATDLDTASRKAEKALEGGNHSQAQAILEGAAG
jgi:hypothetical protein